MVQKRVAVSGDQGGENEPVSANALQGKFCYFDSMNMTCMSCNHLKLNYTKVCLSYINTYYIRNISINIFCYECSFKDAFLQPLSCQLMANRQLLKRVKQLLYTYRDRRVKFE